MARVRAGEGVREMDVVEALQNPDAALVCFGGEPAEHRDVLVELRGGKLLRFGILRQLQQRCERMAVPEEERVGALLGELIEILCPLRLVVEPGEIFRRVWVVVLGAFVGDLGFLQADDGAANS